MKLFQALLLVCLFSCVTAQRNPLRTDGLPIYEISAMSEIYKWITPDTLVIFDLDNTIFETKDPLGNALFYNIMIKKHPEQQKKILSVVWKAIQASEVRPVEESTPEIIHDLQRRGIRVMALTSRDRVLLEATLKQVKSLGIDFSKTSPRRTSQHFHIGILFASQNYPKGKALQAYLKGTGYAPKHIVLIDDLEHNLVNMSQETGAIGLHYPLIEKNKHLWNEQEALQRWEKEQNKQ